MVYVSKRSRRIDRAFAGFLVLIFAIAFLKAFRLPNAYSATTFVLNYSQGFIRRGLTGEAARLLVGDLSYSYWFFVAFAFSVLALVGLALGLLLYRAVRASPRDLGFKCAALVFASSPGLLVFVHTVGYLDHLGFLGLLCWLLWLSRSQSRFLPFYATLALGGLLALIHEVLVPMFCPVMLLALLCHAIRRTPDTPSIGTRASMYAHAGAMTLAILLVSLWVSLRSTEDARQAMALQAELLQKVDFPLRLDVFEAVYRSSRHSLLFLMPAYWSTEWSSYQVTKSLWSIAPGFLYLFANGLRSISQLALSRNARWGIGLCFAGASVAPFTLNLVGWDTNRWNGIALLACFVGNLILKLFFRAPSRPLSLVWATLSVSAVAIGLVSDTPLFDDARVQFFPFDRQFQFIYRVVTDGFSYRPSS